MFPLHDRTRRRIALAAFGALCALPTLLMVLWGLSRQTHWHTAAEARRLERVLGLRVRVDRAWNTKPGVWRYEGLSLYDPESGRRLLRCTRVDASYTGRRSNAPATLAIHAHGPVVDELAATSLYQLLSRAMQGQIGPGPIDVEWTADELVLGEGELAVRLAGISGGARSQPAGSRAQLRFRTADDAGAEPAHIEIYRNPHVSPPALEVKLYTGASPLPCRLLAIGLPAMQPLGPRSRFRGYLRADRTPQGWRGELTGHFDDVDVGQLVHDRFAQPLTGAGQVTVEHARFDKGRIEEAWGSVAIGPGTVGRRLLAAAIERLSLIQSAPPDGYDDPVPYRQLAAKWRVDADGLHIEGRCASAGPGTLLAGTGPWQVSEPVVQPLPVATLVRTLVPDRSPEVPATAEAAWLLRHLPLPESAPSAADRRATETLR